MSRSPRSSRLQNAHGVAGPLLSSCRVRRNISASKSLQHIWLDDRYGSGSRLDLHARVKGCRVAEHGRDRELRRHIYDGRTDLRRAPSVARRAAGLPELRLDGRARSSASTVRRLRRAVVRGWNRIRLPSLQGLRVRPGCRWRGVLPRLALGSRMPAGGLVAGSGRGRVPSLSQNHSGRGGTGRATSLWQVSAEGRSGVLLRHVRGVAGSRIGDPTSGRPPRPGEARVARGDFGRLAAPPSHHATNTGHAGVYRSRRAGRRVLPPFGAHSMSTGGRVGPRRLFHPLMEIRE